VLWSHTTNEIVFTAASLIVAMSAAMGASSSSPAAADTGGLWTEGDDAAGAGDDTAPAWSNDRGGGAAAGSGGGRAVAAAGKQRRFIGHTAYVTCLALGGEGRRLLVSGQEGWHPIVRVWDFCSGECLAILCGEFACVWGLGGCFWGSDYKTSFERRL